MSLSLASDILITCCVPRFVDDAELAYVLTRAREVHDFWHVLFDCNTDIFGELAIKGLEFVQVQSRHPIASNVGCVVSGCLCFKDRVCYWTHRAA